MDYFGKNASFCYLIWRTANTGTYKYYVVCVLLITSASALVGSSIGAALEASLSYRLD